MKKILFLLLSTIAMYGQVPVDATQLENIQITNNVQDLTAEKVNVQSTNGVLNWQLINDFQNNKPYFSTGLLKNGLLTINANNTKFDLSAGIGVYSDFSDPENVTSKVFNFPAFNAVLSPYLNTSNITYVAVNYNGGSPVLVMQASKFSNTQLRDLVVVGAVVHSNFTTINTINNISSPSNDVGNSVADLFNFLGAKNQEGNVYSANGANLQLNKSAGVMFKYGANFHVNAKNPHNVSLPEQLSLTFRYRLRGGFEGTDRINIDTDNYDLNNVLTTVPPAKPYQIQTIFIPQTGQTRLQYGQDTYSTLADAIAAINTRKFVTETNLASQFVKVAYLVVKKGATSLNVAADADIRQATQFDGTASGGVALTYQSIIDALGFTPANDLDALHKTGNETKTGNLNINGLLSINQSIPEASVHIGDGNAIILDRYKNGSPVAPNFLGRAYNGTKIAPTAILDNEDIAIFGAIPYNGIDAEDTKAWLKFKANGNQSGTNRGTKVDLSITPLNALSPARSVLNSDNERVLIADASVVNGIPVSIGWHGKGEVTGENPHRFQVVSDGLNPTITMGNFGGAGSAGNAGGHLWASRGTAASPSAIQSGDYLWSWGFRGQGTTTRAPSSANMSVRATENFTDTTHGTEILFGTNEIGHDANLGRTSEFKMGADGVFSAETMEVQSYSAGNLGSFRLKYHSPTDSRSWRIANDYDAFGDFAILQSTTKIGITYGKKLYIDPLGNTTVYGTITASPATVDAELATLGQAKAVARPYKVYTALLSQSGTNAPVVIGLDNSLGANISWARIGTGTYSATISAGNFTGNRTYLNFQSTTSAVSDPRIIAPSISGTSNSFIFYTYGASSLSDGVLNTTPVEVRIYP